MLYIGRMTNVRGCNIKKKTKKRQFCFPGKQKTGRWFISPLAPPSRIWDIRPTGKLLAQNVEIPGLRCRSRKNRSQMPKKQTVAYTNQHTPKMLSHGRVGLTTSLAM